MEILLAVLLIRADETVAVSQLITEIWGDSAPRRATAGLYVYVSQLRKFLGGPDLTDNRIVTRPPGYQLRMGVDGFDLNDFQGLLRRGREQARAKDHAGAAATFQSALDLWRGPVLQDLQDSPTITAFATWLEELRLECVEMLVDCHLAVGHHRELVGWLHSLITEHPLRESFYRRLMLALYRSERQAEALGVYQRARDTLNDRLGLEPCRPLRELQHAILTADCKLDLCHAR